MEDLTVPPKKLWWLDVVAWTIHEVTVVGNGFIATNGERSCRIEVRGDLNQGSYTKQAVKAQLCGTREAAVAARATKLFNTRDENVRLLARVAIQLKVQQDLIDIYKPKDPR